MTQGVGAYARLARGKETLVRLHLSLPSCATTGQTIQLVGGTLGVSGGGSTITVANPTPVPTSPYPQIVPYSLGPANNSPGDPIFVVPGSAMRPAGTTGSFVITFTPTARYITSSSATPASIGLGSFTATVEKKTNALRLLVIPMGDASKAYDSQFSVPARQAVQDAMQVVSRILPIPDGVTELKPPSGQQASGGLRYTIDPGMLDLGPRGANVLRADGKLCGSATNFTAIKDRLSQYLQSWNTANSSFPADRVLGAIDSAIADGSCVLGMASTTGKQSWVIAFPDAPGAPSKTGGIAVQELGHTMGLVPAARDSGTDITHSPLTEADAGSNRAYNVPLRLWLADDRTVMKYTDSSYNNVNNLFERDDWALVQCRLGGQTSTECATAGTVGSSLGVGADQTFVMTGKTDGTPANTSVFESFFAAGTPRTVLQDPASPYALYQKLGNLLRRRDQVDVSFVKTEHSDSGSDTGPILGDFSFAVPFDSASDRIEFVKETSGGPVILHSIDRSLPPVLNSTTSTFGAGDPPLGVLHNFTDDPSTDDVQPSLTGNGRWIAWAAGPAGARRIFVAPVSDRDAKVMMPAPGGGDFADPAFRNDGGALAFILDGDLYTVPVTLAGSTASFGSRSRIRDAGGTVPDAHHPTWSPNGAEIAFDDGDDIFKRTANGTGSDVALAVTSAVERSPSWSRDASDNRIAYVIEGTTMTVAASISPLSASATDDDVASIKRLSQLRPAGADVLTTSAAVPPPTVTGTVGTVYTVNSNNDIDDGTCDATHCSLREALNAANANSGKDTIHFAIGTGQQTITPVTQLPAITGPVIIDAISQPGYVDHPLIELSGGGSGNGLLVSSSSDSLIRGFVINRFGIGVFISGDRNVVEASYLGTDTTGTIDLGNGAGIIIDSGKDNVIGGSGSAGNLISGNSAGVRIRGGAASTGNVVSANLIGTDVTGTLSLGNTEGVTIWAETNRVGGDTAGERNVISGNATTGVSIAGNISSADGNVVIGNYIGTDQTGTSPIPNTTGVLVNSASGNTIGGTTPGKRNVISGNTSEGVELFFNVGTANYVVGNYIGTDAAGTVALGNGDVGVLIKQSGGNTVGGTTSAEMNIISSNGEGIRVETSDAVGNLIRGNRIGTNAAGSASLGNLGPGIHITGEANGTVVGGTNASSANLISANTGPGIQIDSSAGIGNALQGNSLHSNVGLGIDLDVPPAGVTINDAGDADSGGNGRQNFPVVTGASGSGGTTTITGTLNSLPNKTYRVEFFANTACDPSTYGEGETFIGAANVTTDGSGNASFNESFAFSLPAGSAVTATATDPDGNTSEFSQCQTGAVPTAELSITLEDAPDPVDQHQQLTYTITVSNAGPDDAEGVTVTDTLPSQVAFESSSTTQGTCSGTTNFSCTLGTIGAGNTATVTITVTANTLGTVTNTASVSASTMDTNSTDDEATTTTEVQPATTTPTTDIYRLNPGNPSQPAQLLVLNGDDPAYGNGAVAFNRDGDVWRISPDGSGLRQLTSGSLAGAPALTKSTLAFENTIFEEGCSGSCSSQLDIMLVTLTQTITSTVTDASPGSGTFDVYLDCGDGVLYPLAVGLKPSSTSGNQATLDYTFDPSLSCAGGTIKIAYSDGFSRVTSDTAGAVPADGPPKDPVAEIYGPLIGQQVNEFGLLALSGSGVDPEDGKLPESSFQWLLIPPGSTTPIVLGSGSSLDKSPPAGGWPEGDATVILRVTDSAGNVTSTSTPITFLRDADNDGIPAVTENSQSCLGGGGDSSAANGFGDGDGDGIANYADQTQYGTTGPCSPQPLYQAAATFDPQTFNTSSSGKQVTMYVRNLPRDLNQINASTVRLTEVGGFAVPAGQLIAQSWSIILESGASVGLAKFDRQELAQFITAHGITSNRIAIRIEGASKAAVSPPWRFYGIDTTQVVQG